MGGLLSLETLAEDAARLEGRIGQVMLSDPQSWKGPDADLDAVGSAAEAAGVGLYVHAPYLINVATTNNRVRIPSRGLLQKTLDAAAAVGARGVVVHGGHVQAGDDPAQGFDNWRKAVDGLRLRVPLLIENTAGGANAMARQLDRLAALWSLLSACDNAEQVGFCLDTCHAHAAGLALDGLVGRVMEITGRIDLVHLNDSRGAFGSGVDRHANLGQGDCDPNGLRRVVADANAPVIVETPGGLDGQRADLDWLRQA
ncbi:MAG: deoxyribonuclease IV [Propionibacteriaceae bacterium]|nr:deoxyribonuclease IV [Propionibacteriaceae bacterium]